MRRVSAPAAANGPRLSRTDRREQLLDAAESLVVHVGVDAFTMEGLAAEAGVSKALPYRHFENAGAVLAAVYLREMTQLAIRVATASTGGAPRARARSLARAYLDAIADRSAVLAVLTAPGSWVPAHVDGARRDGVAFVTHLLVDGFRLDADAARARAAIVLGAFTGATDAWAHGDASRETLEALLVEQLLTAVRAPR